MKVMLNPIQRHTSAVASHYDQQATHYDTFNEARSVQINQVIENILHHNNVKSVLDLTCGTGSQVFWLAKQGFDVIGIDINAKMLAIAKSKAKQQNLSLYFALGDMRNSKIGQFDAVLTIFNSIGHLTKEDFELAIQNVYANLKPNGLYIFDIFNLDYLLYEDNITKLTVDWLQRSGTVTARKLQYSTISPNGVLASYDIHHEQIGDAASRITTASQTLQVYSAMQLETLLQHNAFKIVQQTAVDGTPFMSYKAERILTVARKC